MKSYEQLKADKEELTEVLSILLDHAMCAAMATKYKPDSTPDFANIARLLSRVKKG